MNLRQASIGPSAFVVGALVSLLASEGLANAQTEPDAQAAFEELKQGAALRKQARCTEALPLLADSLRLIANVKTLLNLADCEEHVGQLLAAEQHWVQARELAASQNNSAVEEEAVERLGALEPRIPRLTIVLAEEAAASGQVLRDGATVPSTWLGLPVPTDPGHHVIEVIAAGREKTVIELDLSEREDRRVEVAPGPPRPQPWGLPASHPPEPPQPKAGNEPACVAHVSLGANAASSPPARAEPTMRSPLFYSGMGAAALGVVGVGLGVVEGLLAQRDHGDALEGCGGNCTTSRIAQQLQSDARNEATVSTVGFVAGAGLTALGVATLVFVATGAHARSGASGQRSGRTSLAPLVTRTLRGLSLDVSW